MQKRVQNSNFEPIGFHWRRTPGARALAKPGNAWHPCPTTRTPLARPTRALRPNFCHGQDKSKSETNTKNKKARAKPAKFMVWDLLFSA
jgi:hypothetical protein